jgi:mono/diheme cytochrome c family protein
MAEKVWMFGVGCLLLLSLGVAMKKPALSATFTWLAAAGTIATFLWIGKTANYGGQLVYHHGVGTPQPLVRDTGGIEPPGLAMSRGIATSRAAPPPATAPASQAAAPASSPTTVAAGVPPGPTDPLKVAFFREKVYPILSQNCFNCHNPNRARRSGGLDQTTRETIVKGGRSGPAVVPGKPEDSVLVHRIRGDDPDVRIMPPSGQLSDDEIAVIAKWIQDGAAWGATAPVERGSG